MSLHAWCNIVPACKDCDDIKKGLPWDQSPGLDDDRRAAITPYVTEYAYEPDVTELQVVRRQMRFR